MWRLLRELQEVAFPELDKQDLLADLCRALLRCSHWKLAHRYLTASGSTPLSATQAENIVLEIGEPHHAPHDLTISICPKVPEVQHFCKQLDVGCVILFSGGVIVLLVPQEPAPQNRQCQVLSSMTRLRMSHVDSYCQYHCSSYLLITGIRLVHVY